MRILIEVCVIAICKSCFSSTFSAGVKASNFNKQKHMFDICLARLFVSVFAKLVFVFFRKNQRIYEHDNIEKMLALYSAMASMSPRELYA